MKSSLIFLVKLIVLVFLYFICFSAVSAAVFQLPVEQPAPGEVNPAFALFVVSCLNTVLLTYVIVRSRWAGWKLIGAVFLIFFGISTFMPQIETAYFLTRLPPGMLPRILLAGGITAALFSPLAVLVLGKRKHNRGEEEGSSRLNLPLREWAWKLAVIAIAYVVIYFSFGYFIAWQSPAVRAYYGGSDPGSFLIQMASVLRDTPWLVPLQVVRAMLWTALAVLVIRMMRGRWWETGLVVGLLFAVVMNSLLLIPNPFMPAEVRMAHLLETATSNFLFGWLLVWVLFSGRKSNPHVSEGNAQIGSDDRKRSVTV
ncbi:MAG: hypothetical protein ND895_12405 [Pyrinomonadaceae bacterium]|nr:hypothetical protein [Pyrinomonadaceae bacterium]